MHPSDSDWVVDIHPAFDVELLEMPRDLRIEILSHASALSAFGPALGRPLVDTLKGSRHANLKELRFTWYGGIWRVAFAFDPLRRAILLVAGNKRGADQHRFYKRLVAIAEARYDAHLLTLGPPN